MRVDHLIFGAPDLEAGVCAIESLLGVRPAPGGKHPAVGTHNALAALEDGVYLEVIAPDPEQAASLRPLPYGLDSVDQPGLLNWAIKAVDIESDAAQALRGGVDLGPVMPMSRERPDGTRLEWRLTRAGQLVGDGLVPFLIAWGPGPHPSETSPTGCRLILLRGQHPDPDRIGAMLDSAGATLSVTLGTRPALIATIECPRGVVELR